MKKLLSVNILFFLSIILSAQTDILPPELIKPSNGATRQVPNVQLDWYAVAGVGLVQYEVQRDLDETFPNPATVTTTLTSIENVNLRFGVTYYWRVRAMDDIGTSDWSEVRDFTVFDKIDLSAPEDGDTAIQPADVLKWKNKLGATFISGITYYDYEVSLDTNFATLYNHGSVLWQVTSPPSQTFQATTSELLFDTTYYWRARARHSADTSDWSEVWSFSTTDLVTLVSPENNATDQMPDVELNWDAISGAFSYIYEFCTDPSFSVPCQAISETNSVSPSGIMFGTTYYWHVKAAHTQDTSSYSATWSFTAIDQVTLTSPADNSFVPDIFPTLEWVPITGITGFQVYFDVTESFDDADIFMVDGDKNTYKILTALSMGQTYYWKVRGYDDGDTTQWSPTWKFTIGENQGVNNQLSEHTVRIFPNPAKASLSLEFVNNMNEVGVTVSNLLGQNVYQVKFKVDQAGYKRTLDLSQFENGLYVVQVRSGSAIYSRKIVIDK